MTFRDRIAEASHAGPATILDRALVRSWKANVRSRFAAPQLHFMSLGVTSANNVPCLGNKEVGDSTDGSSLQPYKADMALRLRQVDLEGYNRTASPLRLQHRLRQKAQIAAGGDKVYAHLHRASDHSSSGHC